MRSSNPEIKLAPAPTALSVSDPHVRYGSFMVLKGVDPDVARGEFIALLGLCGRGKTSLPRAVAGFVEPRRGASQRARGGRPAASRRTIGIVFQSCALFPYRLALDNAGFGLECRKVRKADASERSRRALDLVGLGAFAERRLKPLSGGQPRRVAPARAMPDR